MVGLPKQTANPKILELYLWDYWPCTHGLSAVIAIATQLLDDLKNSGIDPMVFGGVLVTQPQQSRKLGGMKQGGGRGHE